MLMVVVCGYIVALMAAHSGYSGLHFMDEGVRWGWAASTYNPRRSAHKSR